MAISGNTVVVGSSHHKNGGAAYGFVKPPAGWSDMTQTAELTGSAGHQAGLFASAVAVSNGTVIVGAPSQTSDSVLYSGAAYVYVKPASGWKNMAETAQLSARDATSNGAFGWSVSISADTVAIGAV